VIRKIAAWVDSGADTDWDTFSGKVKTVTTGVGWLILLGILMLSEPPKDVK